MIALTIQEASGVLAQVLLMSLIIERSIQVASSLITPQLANATDLPAPWGRPQIIAAFLVALLSLYVTDFDILAKTLASEPNKTNMFPWLGFLLGAMIIAGGSAGIRQIMNTIKISLVASMEVSITRIMMSLKERQILGSDE